MIFSLLGVLNTPLVSTISVIALVWTGKFVGGGVGTFVDGLHVIFAYTPVRLFISGLASVIFVEAAGGDV